MRIAAVLTLLILAILGASVAGTNAARSQPTEAGSLRSPLLLPR